MVDVSIILVNFKTPEMTKNAIESVMSNSSGFTYEIIVVDNSDDGTFETLCSLMPDDVKCIKAPCNLGFGKGNNLGRASASGRFLMFLNTDTLLLGNAVGELFNYICDKPAVGVVGSNLYTPKLEPYMSFVRYEKNLKNEFLHTLLIYELYLRARKKRDDFNYSSNPLSVKGYVIGASMMMPSEVFDRLGGFNDDIFMFAEESLLCHQVRKDLHLEVVNVPASKVIHFEGASVKRDHGGRSCSFNFHLGNYYYYLHAYGKAAALRYLHIKRLQYGFHHAVLFFKPETQRKFSIEIEACEKVEKSVFRGSVTEDRGCELC